MWDGEFQISILLFKIPSCCSVLVEPHALGGCPIHDLLHIRICPNLMILAVQRNVLNHPKTVYHWRSWRVPHLDLQPDDFSYHVTDHTREPEFTPVRKVVGQLHHEGLQDHASQPHREQFAKRREE